MFWKMLLIAVVFLCTLALSFLGGMYLFDDFGFWLIALTFLVSAVLSILATMGAVGVIILVNEAIMEKELLTPATLNNLCHLL